MYNYFISFVAINKEGFSITGNCGHERSEKIKDLNDIREIEKNLCIENDFVETNINNFIEFK